jgi:hypothetical protein
VRDQGGQQLAYLLEPTSRSLRRLLRFRERVHKGHNTLLAPPPIPAYKACHYGQSSPTRESYYHLADYRDEVESIQGWDLQTDNSAYNSAYNSRNRVLEGII